MCKYGVFSGPYFPAFGQNTEIYGVNLRILSKCEKIWIRKNSAFGHFSRSVFHMEFNLVTVKQGVVLRLSYGQISIKCRLLICSTYSDLSVDGAALIICDANLRPGAY